MPKLTKQEFDKLWLIDEQRKADRLEAIRKAVAKSSVPISDDLLKHVVTLTNTDAISVLRGHPGFALSERREHYRASLSIMLLSLDDLGSALVNFEKQASTDDAEIMQPKNRERLEAVELRI